jgi:hypothetical protein
LEGLGQPHHVVGDVPPQHGVDAVAETRLIQQTEDSVEGEDGCDKQPSLQTGEVSQSFSNTFHGLTHLAHARYAAGPV